MKISHLIVLPISCGFLIFILHLCFIIYKLLFIVISLIAKLNFNFISLLFVIIINCIIKKFIKYYFTHKFNTLLIWFRENYLNYMQSL